MLPVHVHNHIISNLLKSINPFTDTFTSRCCTPLISVIKALFQFAILFLEAKIDGKKSERLQEAKEGMKFARWYGFLKVATASFRQSWRPEK